MSKVTEMHIGLTVLVDNSYKSGRTSPLNTPTSKKIGVVYDFNIKNETCDVIYSNLDDPSFSFINIVKNLQNTQQRSQNKYVESNIPLEYVETLNSSMVRHKQELDEFHELLINKEATVAETDKYIGKVKDELENLCSKINATNDLESVVEIDNGSNSWHLPKHYNYVFRILFYPCSEEEIEEDEHSKLIPFKEPMATAYKRVVKGFRSNIFKKWVEIGSENGVTYFERGNMLLQVVQSQVNNENSEVIRRIYSSSRTKYSWVTKLGADFLILVPDGKAREMRNEVNGIKHAVIDMAEAHKRSYPGRYFYQFVPTSLNPESFEESFNSSFLAEEKEYFALNDRACMRVGTAAIIKPGFTIKDNATLGGPTGCWGLADKVANQIHNHLEHFNSFNGRDFVGVYRKRTAKALNGANGTRTNRNGTANLLARKLVLEHPVSLLISSYLNGQLWKKYNEDKANKAAADILELDKADRLTYTEFIYSCFDQILKKGSRLYESDWQGLTSFERTTLMENKRKQLDSYGRMELLNWFRNKAGQCYERFIAEQLDKSPYKTSAKHLTHVPLQMYVQKQNLDEIYQELRKFSNEKLAINTYINFVNQCIIDKTTEDKERVDLGMALFYQVMDSKKMSKRYKGYHVVRLPSDLIRLDTKKVASNWQSSKLLKNATAIVTNESSVENHMQNLSNIEEIDLRGHRIEFFPKRLDKGEDLNKSARYVTLSHLTSLKILRLSKNMMCQMCTVYNKSLMFLDLSFNKLRKLPPLYCENLQVLNVSNNQLRGSLDVAMSFYNTEVAFKKLETLDLSNNNFSWESEQVLCASSILRDRSPSLKNLMMHNNPFIQRYDTKKKLLQLRSIICNSLSMLLAFSPPTITKEFENKYPASPHEYFKSTIYAWTLQAGNSTIRWHGAYVGTRKTKGSLYDTFERKSVFRETQVKHNFKFRLDFSKILSECERPALENHVFKSMENSLVDGGQSLMQWHKARTKRSQEVMDSNKQAGNFSFKWRILKMMSKIQRINMHRAFSYWKKVAELPFFFLRLFPKEKRMGLMKNIDTSSIGGTLLQQVINRRLKNLHQIILNCGGDVKVSIAFRKWKAYAQHFPLVSKSLLLNNSKNIRITYELHHSKRKGSILQSASRYRHVMQRSFERWKRGDVLQQMESTTTTVCEMHQRIKDNQKQVETLRKIMLSKLQGIDDTFAKVKDKLQEQDEQKREILKLKRQIALNQIESHNLSYQLGNAMNLKPADDEDSILAQTAKGITRYMQA